MGRWAQASRRSSDKAGTASTAPGPITFAIVDCDQDLDFESFEWTADRDPADEWMYEFQYLYAGEWYVMFGGTATPATRYVERSEEWAGGTIRVRLCYVENSVQSDWTNWFESA